MGRRSVNSTKSGKYMNPTDQARKQARRKELKKNKRQRMAVRQAVLKNKDPKEIIKELDKIDKMEFNVDAPAPLSQKVLMEKRKKLRETLERVMKYYEKEDPDYWAEIRRTEAEYEKRRHHAIVYYESVKHAEEVTVDDIPLPKSLLPDAAPCTIPLPPTDGDQGGLTGILKKTHVTENVEDNLFENASLEPPGVPIGPPPDLVSLDLEEQDQPMSGVLSDNELPPSSVRSDSSHLASTKTAVMLNLPPTIPLPRPPIHPPLAAVRLPPGPPPGLPPHLRLPPGPPPIPQSRIPPPVPFFDGSRSNPIQHAGSNQVVSARPQLKDSQQQLVTIEAKPRLRNLTTDVTQFVPSALRVKRGDKKMADKKSVNTENVKASQNPSKDDAYALFMTEMKDLL